MLVVNIGLGKTASTTLQKFVYPYLEELKGVVFNPSVFKRLKINKYEMSGNEKEIFEEMSVGDGVTFISSEDLVNWNPRYWEESANRNLSIFGNKTIILIVLREPVKYLTSVYQQSIHVGDIIPPEEFFTNSNEYDCLQKWLAPNKLLRFDVDSFDMERLVTLYRERFDTVIVTSFEKIGSMEYLRNIFSLNDDDVKFLNNKFINAPSVNKSYSNLAMRLTFKREKILRVFGLKLIGPMDYIPLKESHCNNFVNGRNGIVGRQLFSSLSLKQKIFQLPERLRYRISIILSWRYLMQKIVNKLFVYSKYKIDGDVYLNDSLVEKNRRYIDKVSK